MAGTLSTMAERKDIKTVRAQMEIGCDECNEIDAPVLVGDDDDA
jgi:hypothetical protein